MRGLSISSGRIKGITVLFGESRYPAENGLYPHPTISVFFGILTGDAKTKNIFVQRFPETSLAKPCFLYNTCSLHANGRCGKGEAHKKVVHGDAKAAPVWNYLEVYWPCAGGLSAVSAIGTQLRDPLNSGLTRWRLTVKMWTPSRNSGAIP